MHLVMLFGPPAVGKMTVGRELAAACGYRLFHNHMDNEPVAEIFGWATPSFRRLTKEFRAGVIREALAADLPGLVFTLAWALDLPDDHAYLRELVAPVEAAGQPIDLVELRAAQETRLAREGGADRIDHKRSKRDVEWARAHLLEMDADHRWQTEPGEVLGPWPHHVVENEGGDPAATAAEVRRQLAI